jgi:hypothetical protein
MELQMSTFYSKPDCEMLRAIKNVFNLIEDVEVIFHIEHAHMFAISVDGVGMFIPVPNTNSLQ